MTNDTPPGGPAPDAPKADGAGTGDASALRRTQDARTEPVEGASAPQSSPPAGARTRAFPLAKVIVSAFGIAIGVWVWLGSAWRWDVTPRDLAETRPPVALGAWPGRYVRLVGARESGRPAVEDAASGSVFLAYVGEEGRSTIVKRAAGAAAPEGPVSGRVAALRTGEGAAGVVVDATRGRWDARAAMAVVIVLWGLAHAGANLYLWRRRRPA